MPAEYKIGSKTCLIAFLGLRSEIVERGKKTRQTAEEVGRQHQGMNRPGNRQFPEGSGEQGKMEKTGCKIICGAPTTLAAKGLMMMMMMRLKFVFSPDVILCG